MKSTITALAAFASVASAHFNLNFPTVRGFNEDKLSQFPCGSFDTVSSTRTPWPMTGGSIALTMGHIDATVEVTIAFGNSPGSSFNTVLKKPISQTGLGDFCMTGISVPSGLNVTEGTNATIQVLTNGDPDGGLYNCADITFSSTAAAPSSNVCKNGTGIAATVATSTKNPNETTSGTATSSSAGASSSAAKSGAMKALNAGVGGLFMAGLAAVVIVL